MDRVYFLSLAQLSQIDSLITWRSHLDVCKVFLFPFKSVCWYVRSGDLRTGVVPVLPDAKKMTVGRRKRKRGGGAEGGCFIGCRSCPALFDMYK